MTNDNLPRVTSSPTLARLPWERVENGVEIRDRLIKAGVDLVGEVEALADEHAGDRGFSADDILVIDAVLILGKRIGLGTWTVIDVSEEMSINDLPWSLLGREALAVRNRLRQHDVSSISDLKRRPQGFLTQVVELNTFQAILVERVLALAGRWALEPLPGRHGSGDKLRSTSTLRSSSRAASAQRRLACLGGGRDCALDGVDVAHGAGVGGRDHLIAAYARSAGGTARSRAE